MFLWNKMTSSQQKGGDPPSINKVQHPFTETQHIANNNNISRPTEIHMISSHQNFIPNVDNPRQRKKVPSSLQDSLKKHAQQSEVFKNTNSNQGFFRIGKAIAKKFNKSTLQCTICFGNHHPSEFVKLFSCNHLYCKNCLQNYVAYKIKMYEQVLCPDENCDILMDQNSQFFLNLCDSLQKQYLKIHNFHVTSKDPNLRLCPKQSCDGVLKITEKQPIFCDSCKRSFCPKCYLQAHENSCNQKEVDFFQNNLHYRQCQNCKMMIERIEGCNHMTCKCKYEFCYICGQKWVHNHQCPARVNEDDQPNNLECQCCIQTCANGINFSELIYRIAMTIGITFIHLLYFFLCRIVLMIMGFCLSIIMGILAYPIIQVMDTVQSGNRGLTIVYMLCFVPITILVGIYRGLKQIFIQLIVSQMIDFWEVLNQSYTQIWP